MTLWNTLSVFVTAAAILCPAVEGRHDNRLKLRHIGRAPATSKSVIVEMFQWSWDSVAQECTNFLGPAGYGYVQGELFSTCLSRSLASPD